MGEENKCMALTSNGESCNNTAIYPEDNPKACHIKSHQAQMEVDLNEIVNDEAEIKEELKENPKPPLKETKEKRWITDTMYVI